MKQQIKSYNSIRFSQIHSVFLQPLERNIQITQKKTKIEFLKKGFIICLFTCFWAMIESEFSTCFMWLWIVIHHRNCQNNNLLHIWKTGKIFSITYYICSFEKQHASNVMAGALQKYKTTSWTILILSPTPSTTRPTTTTSTTGCPTLHLSK